MRNVSTFLGCSAYIDVPLRQNFKAHNMTYLIELLQRLERNTLLAAKRVLNIEDAALLTGLTVQHLYKLTSARQIPFSKPNGKQVYFDKEELENWMRKGRVKTIDEIRADEESRRKEARR